MAEFDAGVVAGELPDDFAFVGVGVGLPGGEFGVEQVEIVDASVQALAGESGQFDLGDVEPGPVFRGVVDLQAFGQRSRPGRLERFVQGSEGVGVQVVHNQHDPRGVGVVDLEEARDLGGPVNPGPPRAGIDPALPGEGFDPHEDRAGAVADVLRILFAVMAWAGWDRLPRVSEQLVGLLVHAHHRHIRVIRSVIDLQDVLHAGHELAVGLGRDRPALGQMKTKPLFLRSLPIVE